MTKPLPVRVPRTLAAALPLLERFAALRSTIASMEACRAEDLARINAAIDVRVAPLLEETEQLRTALEPWWAKDGAAQLQGKRKTAELGGCTIGTKTGKAKVAFEGDDDAAIAAVRAARLGKALLNVKTSLDRAAVMRMLKSSTAAKLTDIGFSIDQGEQFVLEPIEGAPIGQLAA